MSRLRLEFRRYRHGIDAFRDPDPFHRLAFTVSFEGLDQFQSDLDLFVAPTSFAYWIFIPHVLSDEASRIVFLCSARDEFPVETLSFFRVSFQRQVEESSIRA